MLKVFRIIKRKRNLRRLSAVWLCLVFVELFCPVICDEPTFVAQNKSSQTEIAASMAGKDDNAPTVMTACNNQETGNHEDPVCGDECLCHAHIVTSLNSFNFSESIFRREKISFNFGNPILNSLPPPFQPPKHS
jgi:hypothetical protein